MRHRIKKIKFKKGKDAIKSTIRKLVFNFIKKGKIETTLKKAKILKGLIDSLTAKAQEKKESVKNILFKYLNDKEMIDKIFNSIAPNFKDRKGGFVRIIKTGARFGDGAEMSRIEWVKSIEINSPGMSNVPPAGSKKILKVKKENKKDEHAASNKIDKTSK